MKKLFLSLVAVIMAATASYAQSSLIATLSHNGEISVFHGSSSLRQAMEAAEHGDVITLAGGRYDAVDITKAVTLRGAGMQEDATAGTIRTEISGDFSINIADLVSESLTIEGIYHENTITISGTLNNAKFQKSQFYIIQPSSNDAQINSLTCIHCYIKGKIFLPNNNCSANFINSVVDWPSPTETGSMEFTNCMIINHLGSFYNSYFINCFFYSEIDTSILNNTNMAVYCICSILGNGNYFQNIPGTTNKRLERSVFKALFKANTFYELTDEAKQEYIGNDGTEIGIYGGNLPYDPHVISPQITKCNVAAKTTTDGKLSVDIEVKAE